MPKGFWPSDFLCCGVSISCAWHYSRIHVSELDTDLASSMQAEHFRATSVAA